MLPFDNLGGDEATGRLADGITEDIITDLARFRDLDVIARNSTEAYKGKPVDVRQVGKELSVGYVLEGSVQRQGETVRVTAQLIDAVTGRHIWSERWERPTADIFAVQTELAERVANTLASFGGVLESTGAGSRQTQTADRFPGLRSRSACPRGQLPSDAGRFRARASLRGCRDRPRSRICGRIRN